MAVWIIIAETKVHGDVTSRIIGCTRIARLPFEGVVTGTAVQDIIPLTTDDKVIPTTAKDKIIPGAAVKYVSIILISGVVEILVIITNIAVDISSRYVCLIFT